MSIHDIDKRVQVRIANDGSEATLRITPDFPMEMLSIDVLRPVIEESGVEWNEHVDQRLRDLISQPPQADGSIEGTIAVATPVRHGSDGYVEWYVDEHDEQQTDEQSEQIDFYEQCAFVMVESGQTIGKVIEPDGGEDGRDVTGKTWQAKACSRTGRIWRPRNPVAPVTKSRLIVCAFMFRFQGPSRNHRGAGECMGTACAA